MVPNILVSYLKYFSVYLNRNWRNFYRAEASYYAVQSLTETVI